MTVLTDTANGVTMARKDRDNAIKALDDEYKEARKELSAAAVEANNVLADFDRTYRNSRQAIAQTHLNKVAELTGVDPEDVNRDEYDAVNWKQYFISPQTMFAR